MHRAPPLTHRPRSRAVPPLPQCGRGEKTAPRPIPPPAPRAGVGAGKHPGRGSGSPPSPEQTRPLGPRAAAVEEDHRTVRDPRDYLAEWKWDGIRVQLVARGGERRLYSRSGDDIGGAFPDVLEALPGAVTLDGELLVIRGGEIAPFNNLQQRLNR